MAPGAGVPHARAKPRSFDAEPFDTELCDKSALWRIGDRGCVLRQHVVYQHVTVWRMSDSGASRSQCGVPKSDAGKPPIIETIRVWRIRRGSVAWRTRLVRPP